MPLKKRSIEEYKPFDNSELFEGIDNKTAAALAMSAGDLLLILNKEGKILDSSSDLARHPEVASWTGKDWSETVTIESQDKIDAMLDAARQGTVLHPRQVNHKGESGDLPISYVIVCLSGGKKFLAIGKDLREAAALQQRLLQTQQSLERDYQRLRQLETRYRLLFEMSGQPVVIIDHESRRIIEANPAACTLLGSKHKSLAGTQFLSLFQREESEKLISFLGGAVSATKLSPLQAQLSHGATDLWLSATSFSQRGKRYALIYLESERAPTSEEGEATLAMIEKMPDAFVLTDCTWSIISGNIAFTELVGVASIDQIRGRNLGDFIGRPGIDLDLIQSQLRSHGFAQNASTVVGNQDGSEGEPIEISAVQAGDEQGQGHFGIVIRSTGRRLRDLPPVPQEMPRSVEQLTELVGRMSLKDIVRESTDLIERLCIEAALSYTSDNRASAAEVLGLSRQSLYSKLHRYNLGNLVSEPE